MVSRNAIITLSAMVTLGGVASAQQQPPDPAPPTEPAPPSPPPEPSARPEKPADPFAYADFTWLNGNSRERDTPLDSKVFTGQFSLDTNYTYSFARPKDHSLVGSTTSGRAGEVQISDLGIGGDLHWNNVRGRVMSQFGLYSTMQPRNDSSPSRGQWNVLNGINLDVGLFMSYVGLCSYYDFENWVYQESYVSANTPWFFQGVRIQFFLSDKLKIEPWIINGWQSYGMFNEQPGVGLQVLWRPEGWFSLLSNSYWGADALGIPHRQRYHSDDSIQIKYFDDPKADLLSKAAFSLTLDAGCENGGGVSCTGNGDPAQYFLGFMFYNRLWFDHDLYGVTLGGGAITNPGQYLVLLPAINGATAASGTPYFPEAKGSSFKAWDTSLTLDYMPNQFLTFRVEYNHRWASVPYFAGPGGITPPGGNQGDPGSMVAGWKPDLRKDEDRMQAVLMVRI
jgi:hypothetical protein